MDGDNEGVCFGVGFWSQWIYGIDGICMDYIDCVEKGWKSIQNGWDGVSEFIMLLEFEWVGLLIWMSFLVYDIYNVWFIWWGLKIWEMFLCDFILLLEDCDVVKLFNLMGICEGEDGFNGQLCSDDLYCVEGEMCKDWDKEVIMIVCEKVEELIEMLGISCVGCYVIFINGFGYVFGYFFFVGKYWEIDLMFYDGKYGVNYGFEFVGQFCYYFKLKDEWVFIDMLGSFIFNG